PEQGRLDAWRACELGHRPACGFLAQSNEGRTFPAPEGAQAYVDEVAWAAMQRRYCGLGGHQACLQWAMAQLRQAEHAPDPSPVNGALETLDRSCREGNERGCHTLLSLVSGALRGCEEEG